MMNPTCQQSCVSASAECGRHRKALRILYLITVFSCIFVRMSAQSLRGVVVDENGQPMSFATVALYALPDSAVVGGGISDEEGRFDVERPDRVSYLQFSVIGYRTVVVPLASYQEDMTIQLLPDTKLLDEVVIKASLPKTTVKGDAVVTGIEGSVLEHTGNALDVLAKVPGMIAGSDGLQVLGRGTPVYYINGRKVTDNSELRNLMSEDIKSIEVVSNPGALYDAEVSCVVRIRTVRRQGDGFSYALTSQARQHVYACHDFDPSWTVLDLNYRKGGWDFFGKLVYWNQRNYQYSHLNGGTFTTDPAGTLHANMQEGILDCRGHNGGVQGVGGANWQINDNHSVGFKLDHNRNTIGHTEMVMDVDVFRDDVLIDHVRSVNDISNADGTQTTGNIYYDGTMDRWNINFNGDFLRGATGTDTQVDEEGWTAPAQLASDMEAGTFMGAGKLVASRPLGKGSLQMGTEETWVGSWQTYQITKTDIPATDISLTEMTYAGFAQYATSLSFGQVSAGLRYEHDVFAYTDNLDAENSLYRVDNNWFPSFAFSTKLGETGLNLSYTGKTLRPSYNVLTSEITYDNRFTYQTGNPRMKNETKRTLSLNASRKWLTLTANYERVDNGIYQKGYPYNDEGVVMIQFTNIDDPYRKLSAYVNASPSIGVWYPNYTIGIDKPFFTTTLTDPRVSGGVRTITLNRPMYLLAANNAFRLPAQWVIDADYQFTSAFDNDITHILRPRHVASMAVTKTLLKNDALVLRLSWQDIFNRSVYYFFTDYGNFICTQDNNGYAPCLELRASYRFNSANSKYKGTGAGQDAKNRL